MKKTRLENNHLRGKIMETFKRSDIDKSDLASKIKVDESTVDEVIREEYLIKKNDVMAILDQNRLK